MQEKEKLDQSLSRRPTPPLTPPLLFYKLIVSSILQAKKLVAPTICSSSSLSLSVYMKRDLGNLGFDFV